jgi:two-component system response regulator YesN
MLRQYVLLESLLSALVIFESVGVPRNKATEMLGDLAAPGKFNDSVDTAKDYLHRLLTMMLEYRNQLSDMKYSEIIEKAKAYIKEQYHNEDMSLQSVSSHVNVSSNHFSAIFRKETGVTFIDYLTTVRMDKAKDLLMSTSMKTSEIGFEVGYRDPHYFSYIFKKTQGMSPKEYRKEKKQ